MAFILVTDSHDPWLANVVRAAVAAAIAPLMNDVSTLSEKVTKLMAEIDNLKAADAALDTTVQAVLAKFSDLSAQLQAALAANDPAAVQAVADDINAQAAALTAAITPAPAPAPTPAP